MPPTWPLVATLGTYCGAPFNVLCAWLARDGASAWLFDDGGWLRRVDLRSWDASAWRVIEQREFDTTDGFTAQFAALSTSSEPFLWVSYGHQASDDDREEPCTVSVYALSERGPELVRTMPFNRRADAGPNRVGAECSAVIVRETSVPERAHVFMPDGTPLGLCGPSVIFATSRGYWEKKGDRFEFRSHDGAYLGGAEVPYSDDWSVLGPADESRLALESVSEIALVHGERSRCDRAKTGLDFEGYFYDFWGGSRRPQHVLHTSGAIAHTRTAQRGSPRAAYAIQPWASPEPERISFGEKAILQWLDERWALATTRGQCALFDRARSEMTQSHCPPVTAIALGDATHAIVVQHEGGLTRWWDARSQSIIAEDRSPLATERTLVGLRCGSTRALFFEQPTFGELTLVERALVDGAARELWSASIAIEGERGRIAALGEDHAIVHISDFFNRQGRAVLVSRDSTTAMALEEGRTIHGRLVSDRGELVLEQQLGTGPGSPTSILQRERIHADATRSVIDVRPLDVRGGAVATRAGFVDTAVNPTRIRFVERTANNAAIEHACRAITSGMAYAQDALRVAARTHNFGSVCVVDATHGVVAQWSAIEHDDEITALAISDDGATVAVGTASGRVLVYTTSTDDSRATGPEDRRVPRGP